MRDKLIELLKRFDINIFADFNPKVLELLADHLLAEGVIVPKLKKGDKVYYISASNNIVENKVYYVGAYWIMCF